MQVFIIMGGGKREMVGTYHSALETVLFRGRREGQVDDVGEGAPVHGRPHRARPPTGVRMRAAERGGRGRVGHGGARVVASHQRQRSQQEPPWLFHLRSTLLVSARAFLASPTACL